MKILAIYFVYNERNYLPTNIDFWKKQGVDVYVIDNMSNDGTWEWLLANGIPSHRFSTNESFHLDKLQREAERVIHKIKPDWVIFASADLYYVTDFPLSKTIEYLTKQNYNQIEMYCWMMKSTGESFSLPFWNKFYYGNRWSRLILISKYDETLRYEADKFIIRNAKPAYINGVIVNYGGCKPKKEMEVKLARREKAWKEGLNKDWGHHYRNDKARNWTFQKHELTDIRNHEDYKYFNKICTILS